MSKNVIPINRINKWFSDSDFNLEVSFAREAIEGDQSFTVVLFKVDRESTQSDDLYGEGEKDGIRFFPPVELKVLPVLSEGENKNYNGNSTLRVLDDGPLVFSIYDAQLVELDTTVSYGDYIGYAVSETEMRYYTVSNDGVKNFDNRHTIMGYKAAMRTVVCAPVDETEFRAL